MPKELIVSLEQIRESFFQCWEKFQEAESFSLLVSSPPFQERFRAIEEKAKLPKKQSFSSLFTCAIIGSSTNGKTTVLAEMFPHLAEKGWLQTQTTDTTSQALKIQYASDSEKEDDIEISPWKLEKIKSFFEQRQIQQQNQKAGIEVRMGENSIVVDGSNSFLEKEEFRFSLEQVIRPFLAPVKLQHSQIGEEFIRALTVKELSSKINSQPVLNLGEENYNSLQLRAIIKDIQIHDKFNEINRWIGEEAKNLIFVDTPGIAVQGSSKDEVLRFYLANKSNQVILELLKEEELDIIIHMVLCGKQSDFSSLWEELVPQFKESEVEDLSRRLILAINGMNLYFTNPDLRERWENPALAEQKGDHFEETIEDNIIHKMLHQGKVRPAHICFLDSHRFVEGDYEKTYRSYQDEMKKWIEPEGVGYKTLKRLGLLETFAENIKALGDPEDRGQGFLVQQIQNLIQTEGKRLKIQRYLKRNRLLEIIGELKRLIQDYYDPRGGLSTQAMAQSIQTCLNFFHDLDEEKRESFIQKQIDGQITHLFTETREEKDWIKKLFFRFTDQVLEKLLETSNASGDQKSIFKSHYKKQVNLWSRQWGYEGANFKFPRHPKDRKWQLLQHTLQTHAREIIYQLLRGKPENSEGRLEQSFQDKEEIQAILNTLESIYKLSQDLCLRHGVSQ